MDKWVLVKLARSYFLFLTTENKTVGFLGKLYCHFSIYWLTGYIGALYLVFFRLAYPGFKIGLRPKVWGRFSIQIFQGGRLEIGDEFHLVSDPKRSGITLFSRGQFTVFSGGVIKIGNHVGLNGTAITSKCCVEIGDGTIIGPNVVIVDSDFHNIWPPESRWEASSSKADKEVSIGSNVWVGMNTIILKGSRIGDNSVIGAGSVVRGEIPADCIAAGNPAQVVRNLKNVPELS
jgi:acetyltransferase-like isoleucine patch superfamily enzyme